MTTNEDIILLSIGATVSLGRILVASHEVFRLAADKPSRGTPKRGDWDHTYWFLRIVGNK